MDTERAWADGRVLVVRGSREEEERRRLGWSVLRIPVGGTCRPVRERLCQRDEGSIDKVGRSLLCWKKPEQGFLDTTRDSDRLCFEKTAHIDRSAGRLQDISTVARHVALYEEKMTTDMGFPRTTIVPQRWTAISSADSSTSASLDPKP